MMYKYYIKTNGNIITMLGKAKKVPNRVGYSEVTKAQYDAYMETLNSIEDKKGYTKKVTLYVDGTYDVEYLPIVEIEESDEE